MTVCIWYISKYVAPPTRSGQGGRGYELMRELAALGHECVIVTSDSNHLVEVPELEDSYLTQRRDGLQVCWLRTVKVTRAKSLRRIVSWLHFEWRLLRFNTASLPRPDVVVVSSLSLLTIMNGIRLKWRLGARLVFEVRDIWPLTLTDGGGYSPRNPLILVLGTIERVGYRFADAIVGTMPNLGEHVANVLGYEKPVECIPMGYSPKALPQATDLPDGFAESYLTPGQFTVAYAGTIGRSNALETLFAAAEKMRSRSEIRFLVVGEGSLLSSYREQFDHLPNLTFAPRIPKSSVQTLLARCDVLYLSTRPSEIWRYGQSMNKLVDYMLAGKPILASFSGYQSMVNDAGCGTFIPSGDVDALVRELDRYLELEEDERHALGHRGRDWILQHRSYPQLARDYEQILLPDTDAVPGHAAERV